MNRAQQSPSLPPGPVSWPVPMSGMRIPHDARVAVLVQFDDVDDGDAGAEHPRKAYRGSARTGTSPHRTSGHLLQDVMQRTYIDLDWCNPFKSDRSLSEHPSENVGIEALFCWGGTGEL